MKSDRATRKRPRAQIGEPVTSGGAPLAGNDVINHTDLPPRIDAKAATILIVDDDALVCDAVLAMLEREDRRVVVCGDARSAQLALREFRFTHVVCDLQLSELPFEGVAFVDFVRQALPTARIVVMTGYPSPIVRSTALAVGADAFLPKPFGASDIAYALRLDTAPPDATSAHGPSR